MNKRDKNFKTFAKLFAIACVLCVLFGMTIIFSYEYDAVAVIAMLAIPFGIFQLVSAICLVMIRAKIYLFVYLVFAFCTLLFFFSSFQSDSDLRWHLPIGLGVAYTLYLTYEGFFRKIDQPEIIFSNREEKEKSKD
jgi:hypothetical protein